jgi:LacI family transcriptional regulator
MATIYEVAKLAGVSPAAVSRVMNGGAASAKMREKVRAAAKKLAFKPNRTARSLRKQSSEVIALVIPDIENPFFTSLARGVEDRAQKSGLSVVLCNTDDDPGKETHYLEIALAENMAGVILAPSPQHGDLRPLIERGCPVVAVDRRTEFNIDAVLIDNRAAGIVATTALFNAGHKRIACIAGPPLPEAPDERAAGWREIVRQRGGPNYPKSYLRQANYRVDGGRSAMTALLALSEPPDAVVATNNLMGVGALQILTEAGLAPPRIGMAVIGDLPFPTFPVAAITQVLLPARQLGVAAADLLIDRINGDDRPARTIMLRNDVAPT